MCDRVQYVHGCMCVFVCMEESWSLRVFFLRLSPVWQFCLVISILMELSPHLPLCASILWCMIFSSTILWFTLFSLHILLFPCSLYFSLDNIPFPLSLSSHFPSCMLSSPSQPPLFLFLPLLLVPLLVIPLPFLYLQLLLVSLSSQDSSSFSLILPFLIVPLFPTLSHPTTTRSHCRYNSHDPVSLYITVSIYSKYCYLYVWPELRCIN